MSIRESRLRSTWTSHYDEPELKVTEEFQELGIVEISDVSEDPDQAVVYGPDDSHDHNDWLQIDADAVVTPER